MGNGQQQIDRATEPAQSQPTSCLVTLSAIVSACSRVHESNQTHRASCIACIESLRIKCIAYNIVYMIHTCRDCIGGWRECLLNSITVALRINWKFTLCRYRYLITCFWCVFFLHLLYPECTINRNTLILHCGTNLRNQVQINCALFSRLLLTVCIVVYFKRACE